MHTSTLTRTREKSVKTMNGHPAHLLVQPKCVILILEDFDEIRAFLARHYVQQGYELFSAATLRDGMAIAWEDSPQLILVDYDLGGETAIHAIERLHEAQPHSYIVLLGGPQTIEVGDEAILAGASKVLSKAYNISEMDAIVETATYRSTYETPGFLSNGL
jgi:ActR/RegA family two-component response regulator